MLFFPVHGYPNKVRCVYAVVGNPSNPLRVICIKVVDKLNAEGPKWKYYLSTCGGTKKLKCSVRATEFVKRSIQEKTSLLPTLGVLRHSPRKKEKSNCRNRQGEHRHLTMPQRKHHLLRNQCWGGQYPARLGLDLMDRPVHLQAKRTCVDRQEQSPNASNL